MRLRALAPGDDIEIARLFADTLVLGEPLGFDLARLREYQHQCLAWYLTQGRDDAAVVDHDDQVVGYALVCTDEAGFARWSSRAAVRFVAASLVTVASGRMPAPSRRFYWARARDGFTLWRRRQAPPMPVHAHVNIAHSVRTATAVVLLRDHIDERTRRAGAPGWYGEMNARRGDRERALRWLGIDIVRRDPNWTFTRAIGEPVDRLTLVRHCTAPAETDGPPR